MENGENQRELLHPHNRTRKTGICSLDEEGRETDSHVHSASYSERAAFNIDPVPARKQIAPGSTGFSARALFVRSSTKMTVCEIQALNCFESLQGQEELKLNDNNKFTGKYKPRIGSEKDWIVDGKLECISGRTYQTGNLIY